MNDKTARAKNVPALHGCRSITWKSVFGICSGYMTKNKGAESKVLTFDSASF
jgi:hypothetical protein